MKIRRYFPNFVEVNDEDYETIEFKSIKQFEAIRWIKHWMEMSDFERFIRKERMLFAQLKNGESWCVGRFLKKGL